MKYTTIIALFLALSFGAFAQNKYVGTLTGNATSSTQATNDSTGRALSSLLATNGNGAGLTNLSAATLTGTLPLAQLDPAVLTNGQAGVNLGGTFTGNAVLSSLFVTNLASRNYVAINGIGAGAGGRVTNLITASFSKFSFTTTNGTPASLDADGSLLTNLNPANIASGTAHISVDSATVVTGAQSNLISSALQNIPVNVVTNNSAQQIVQSFCIANNITDPYSQWRLNGAVSEFVKIGRWSNVVDILPMLPMFNAKSNSTTLFGHTLVCSNAQTSAWGMQLQNGTARVNGYSITSNTIYARFRQPFAELGVGGDAMYWFFGLVNTNDFSAEHFCEQTYHGNPFVQQRQGTLASEFSNNYTNIIYASGPNTTAWPGGGSEPEYPYQPFTQGISSDGSGNITVWNTGVQGGIGNAHTVFTSQASPPCTNFLQAIYLGSDITNYSDQYRGVSKPNQTEEIQTVIVLNCVGDSNIIAACERACQWLSGASTRLVMMGDSRMVGSTPNNLTGATFPWYMFADTFTGINGWWENTSAGGQRLAYICPGGIQNNSFTNYFFSVPPAACITASQFILALGINDVFANGTAWPNIVILQSNFVQTASANGWSVQYVLPYGINTNATALTWTAAGESNRLALCAATLTNSYMFTKVWRTDQFVTPAMLQNTNIFPDGVHANTLTTPLEQWFNQQIAAVSQIGNQTLTPVGTNGPVFVGNHVGDGSGLTNISYGALTGTPTLKAVLTNTFLIASNFVGNTRTNISVLNLTNLPVGTHHIYAAFYATNGSGGNGNTFGGGINFQIVVSNYYALAWGYTTSQPFFVQTVSRGSLSGPLAGSMNVTQTAYDVYPYTVPLDGAFVTTNLTSVNVFVSSANASTNTLILMPGTEITITTP